MAIAYSLVLISINYISVSLTKQQTETAYRKKSLFGNGSRRALLNDSEYVAAVSWMLRDHIFRFKPTLRAIWKWVKSYSVKVHPSKLLSPARLHVPNVLKPPQRTANWDHVLKYLSLWGALLIQITMNADQVYYWCSGVFKYWQWYIIQNNTWDKKTENNEVPSKCFVSLCCVLQNVVFYNSWVKSIWIKFLK